MDTVPVFDALENVRVVVLVIVPPIKIFLGLASLIVAENTRIDLDMSAKVVGIVTVVLVPVKEVVPACRLKNSAANPQ
tara:strand:+ start:103 stop:336 length:234 start_codon:yes stop_codon:yes gene_type:complete